MSAPTGAALQTLTNMIMEAKDYVANAPDGEDATEMQQVLDALQELMTDVDDVATDGEAVAAGDGDPAPPESRNRPVLGQVEQRDAPVLEADGKRIRGKIPYGVESRDMGGWNEIIEPGALNSADLGDLVAVVDHAGLPLGRYPGTLELEDRSDGMHWSVSPPESRQDVREAIQRGDLKGGSWRMVVGKDEWRGDTRHVKQISALRDVSIVTTGAYAAEHAAVELRSQPNPGKAQEDTMGNEPENTEKRSGALNIDDTHEKPGPAQVDFHGVIVNSIKNVRVGETRSLNDDAWMNLTELRALTSSGSPLSPSDLSTNLFQTLRASSIALKSGIGVIETQREKVIFPKLSVDTAPGFVSEGGTIPYGDPTFVSLTSEPQKIAHLVAVSNEVIDDSDPPVLRVLSDNITTTMGLKLDSAVYIGGTALPGITGMNSLVGTQVGGTITTAGTAGPTSYPQLIKGVGLLMAANAPGPYVLACNPATASAFEGLQDTLFQQVKPYNGVPTFYTSTQINAGTAYLYDPSQQWIVRRRDATIEIDRSRLFNSDQSEVRGKIRVNYLCPNPASIVKLTAG